MTLCGYELLHLVTNCLTAHALQLLHEPPFNLEVLHN